MTIVKNIIILYTDTTYKGGGVVISYAPFWETLKRKNVSTYALIYKHGISSATIDRMKKGMGISTMKIDDFCRILDCSVGEVIEYVPDEEKEKK